MASQGTLGTARRWSVRDVARLAGVSVGTVSNVLNNPEVVAPATRTRVMHAITQLGFVRNESARQLRAGRSRMIGLIVLDVANPFFTDVARGVEDLASEAGVAVVLCNSGQDAEKEARYLALLEEQRVQGVLITPVREVGTAVEQMRRRGTPVVLLDRPSQGQDMCSVAVDDVLGGRLAIEHLLERGHQRIAYVGGPEEIQQVKDRLVGARAAFTRGGRSAEELQVISTTALNVEQGRAAAEQLLGAAPGDRVTAVFTANDLLALGVLQALTRAGLRVPQDVAIVGYDDIEFAAAAAVPLSSVRQPRALLGRTAAELLLEEAAAQDHEHRQEEFEPDLIVRASSSPPVPQPRTGRRAQPVSTSKAQRPGGAS